MEEKASSAQAPKKPAHSEHNDIGRGSRFFGIRLPFTGWWPLVAGALAGIALRLTFYQEPTQTFAAMTGAFIYLSPLLVGAVTVYLAERQARRSWSYYFRAPFFANAIYVVGTLTIMIEGLLCAVLIVPLFALMGAIGGLLMGAVCRFTDWPKQTLASVAVLPFLMAIGERQVPLDDRFLTVERRVSVAAPPERVWKALHGTAPITADTYAPAWLHRIGVPLPLSATIEATASGDRRRVWLGKNVYFDERITLADEPKLLRFTYEFHPDSFPPYALDEHVVVGGAYFDFSDTQYRLDAVGAGATELTVTMNFRVSTRFNWYAEPLAEWLIGDLAAANIGHYRRVAEKGAP